MRTREGGKRRAAMHGITLIETTFALLIAALVSAYAIPAYREYRARGHRQAAIQALYACALRWEEDHGTSASGAAVGPAGGVCAGTTDGYRVSVRGFGATSGRDAPDYVIEAVPLSHGPQWADRCGVFTLDSRGRRGNRHANAHGGKDFDGCWRGARR